MCQRKYRNVSRIDASARSGWRVRVRKGAEVFTKTFFDQEHHSNEDALRSALDYRDALLEAIGRPIVPFLDPTLAYKSVSRIDQATKGTHGWYVRVGYRGEWRIKFFSDLQYDGRIDALAAAIAYRDDMEADLGKPRTDRVVPAPVPRNNTGILGVSRVEKTFRDRRGRMQIRAVYEVTWTPEPNTIQRTSVSIDKYGEREALRRAIKLRRDKEREIYGRSLSSSE